MAEFTMWQFIDTFCVQEICQQPQQIHISRSSGRHFGGLAVSPDASKRRGDAGVLWGETIHGVLNHGGRLKISNPDSVRRAIFRCWNQFLHTRKAVAGNVSYTKRLLTAWSKFDWGLDSQKFPGTWGWGPLTVGITYTAWKTCFS